jgi:hypothetical protein
MDDKRSLHFWKDVIIPGLRHLESRHKKDYDIAIVGDKLIMNDGTVLLDDGQCRTRAEQKRMITDRYEAALR